MKKYCEECGTLLEKKFLVNEGMIPYCSKCMEYRFPYFNTAVSMIILNPENTKMLYVKQYGTGKNRLVAGYLNKGENLEHAVYREMGEEIGRFPKSIKFNHSQYFAKSNSLIVNFICELTTEELNCNEEIDEYEWVTIEDSLEKIKDASLAKIFVLKYLKDNNKL
ncbi:MAG: NUDIX domain-containing protein [Acholeplasmatales bacterium]|nr:NUDIX domain-containing protein [Acholeplasmatales bacterium]